MMTYTMNNEKKAIQELSYEELAVVTGGSSDDAFLYKRDGVYYLTSPALGGEMEVEEYGKLLWAIYNEFGPDVTLEFAQMVDPNPHLHELIMVFQPWGVVDHYQRRIDGKVNNWEI